MGGGSSSEKRSGVVKMIRGGGLDQGEEYSVDICGHPSLSETATRMPRDCHVTAGSGVVRPRVVARVCI
eukprot:306908-Prorocentrum_minimum.AAC.7